MHVHAAQQYWPETIQPKPLPRPPESDAERLRAVAEKYGEQRAQQQARQRDPDRNTDDRQRKPTSDRPSAAGGPDVISTGYGYAAAPGHKIDTFI